MDFFCPRLVKRFFVHNQDDDYEGFEIQIDIIKWLQCVLFVFCHKRMGKKGTSFFQSLTILKMVIWKRLDKATPLNNRNFWCLFNFIGFCVTPQFHPWVVLSVESVDWWYPFFPAKNGARVMGAGQGRYLQFQWWLLSCNLACRQPVTDLGAREEPNSSGKLSWQLGENLLPIFR